MSFSFPVLAAVQLPILFLFSITKPTLVISADVRSFFNLVAQATTVFQAKYQAIFPTKALLQLKIREVRQRMMAESQLSSGGDAQPGDASRDQEGARNTEAGSVASTSSAARNIEAGSVASTSSAAAVGPSPAEVIAMAEQRSRSGVHVENPTEQSTLISVCTSTYGGSTVNQNSSVSGGVNYGTSARVNEFPVQTTSAALQAIGSSVGGDI